MGKEFIPNFCDGNTDDKGEELSIDGTSNAHKNK